MMSFQIALCSQITVTCFNAGPIYHTIHLRFIITLEKNDTQLDELDFPVFLMTSVDCLVCQIGSSRHRHNEAAHKRADVQHLWQLYGQCRMKYSSKSSFLGTLYDATFNPKCCTFLVRSGLLQSFSHMVCRNVCCKSNSLENAPFLRLWYHNINNIGKYSLAPVPTNHAPKQLNLQRFVLVYKIHGSTGLVSFNAVT